MKTPTLTELITDYTRIRGELKKVYTWFDTERPDWDEYFSMMALVVATRGSCCRRRVGCVLVSSDNMTLSTGYNGKAAGLVNCLDRPCSGATSGGGANLDNCEAIHAELNAVLRCKDVDKVSTAYVTCSPCVSCVNVLLGTSATRIVFTELYANSSESERRWKEAGREWIYLDIGRPKSVFATGCGHCSI